MSVGEGGPEAAEVDDAVVGGEAPFVAGDLGIECALRAFGPEVEQERAELDAAGAEQREAEVGFVDGAEHGFPLAFRGIGAQGCRAGDGGGEAAELRAGIVAGAFIELFGGEQRLVGRGERAEQQRGRVRLRAAHGSAAGDGEAEVRAGGRAGELELEFLVVAFAAVEPERFDAEPFVEAAPGRVAQQRILAGDGRESAFGEAGDEDGVEAEGAGGAGGVADQHAAGRGHGRGGVHVPGRSRRRSGRGPG